MTEWYYMDCDSIPPAGFFYLIVVSTYYYIFWIYD